MGRLKLDPEPTFKAKVEVELPGGPTESIEFTFKHRTRDELDAFIAASAERPDAATILEMASAWDLVYPFTEESLAKLMQNYIGVSRLVFEKYLDELTKNRAKN